MLKGRREGSSGGRGSPQRLTAGLPQPPEETTWSPLLCGFLLWQHPSVSETNARKEAASTESRLSFSWVIEVQGQVNMAGVCEVCFDG